MFSIKYTHQNVASLAFVATHQELLGLVDLLEQSWIYYSVYENLEPRKPSHFGWGDLKYWSYHNRYS